MAWNEKICSVHVDQEMEIIRWLLLYQECFPNCAFTVQHVCTNVNRHDCGCGRTVQRAKSKEVVCTGTVDTLTQHTQGRILLVSSLCEKGLNTSVIIVLAWIQMCIVYVHAVYSMDKLMGLAPGFKHCHHGC